jgi:hypothetical protein
MPRKIELKIKDVRVLLFDQRVIIGSVVGKVQNQPQSGQDKIYRLQKNMAIVS